MKLWKRMGIVLLAVLVAFIAFGCANPTGSDGDDDGGSSSGGGDTSDSPWTTSSALPGLAKWGYVLGFEVNSGGIATVLSAPDASPYALSVQRYSGGS